MDRSPIFHILQCFATKLHYFTKFRMLFPAVLMNIPNSKVCLKGNGPLSGMLDFICSSMSHSISGSNTISATRSSVDHSVKTRESNGRRGASPQNSLMFLTLTRDKK